MLGRVGQVRPGMELLEIADLARDPRWASGTAGDTRGAPAAWIGKRKLKPHRRSGRP